MRTITFEIADRKNRMFLALEVSYHPDTLDRLAANRHVRHIEIHDTLAHPEVKPLEPKETRFEDRGRDSQAA